MSTVKSTQKDFYFLNDTGEMATLIKNYDWSKTALGHPSQWPISLRVQLSMMLKSRFPMLIFWGKELITFYNDAFRPYIIGFTAEAGGFGIYKWNGSDWTKLNGAATRITVDNTGTPWVVNSSGNIFRRNGNSWSQVTGKARDIGAGINGSVFIIGTTAVGGGHNIYQWSGGNWVEIQGGAEFIDVGSSGLPWVVNDNKNIFNKL